MSKDPRHINITMPVFQRFEVTRKTLMSLKAKTRHWPHEVSVVDNGSEPEVVSYLIRMKEEGLIDNLYLLDRNLGISCACNISWQLIDATYYMKLDNDIQIHNPTWIEDIFRLWSYRDDLSNIGPAWTEAMLYSGRDVEETPAGRIGRCLTNLTGNAVIIPKAVSDILGYWNEDYGLYGAEDGDYGMRMGHARFRQYYYYAPAHMADLGTGVNFNYGRHSFDKLKMHRELFGIHGHKIGIFQLNNYLFRHGMRSLKPVPRYEITDIDGYNVKLRLSERYKEVRAALTRCSNLINSLLPTEDGNILLDTSFQSRIKEIINEHGAF